MVLAFAEIRVCLSRQWEGCPLGLGLVVEDKPTEFSCMGTDGWQNFDTDVAKFVAILMRVCIYIITNAKQ